MPISLALSIYIVFVVVAFRNDYLSLEEKVSSAVWIPFIWMTICGSRSLTQWLNISTDLRDYDEANLQGSPIDRTFLSLIILLGICILWKRRGLFLNMLRENRSILLFLIYLGMSALWSDMSAVSLRRWFSLVGGFIMATAILSERAPLHALKMALRRCAYLLIPLSVLYVKYFPENGIRFDWDGKKAWAGVAYEKNGLGHLCLVSIFVLIWSIITEGKVRSGRRKMRLLFDIVVIVMALWLLKGPENAYSATSIAALVFGVGICLLLRLPIMKRNSRSFGTFLLFSLGLLVVIQVAFNPLGMLVQSLGRDMTLTGRTPLWNALMELGLQKPILGYGYGGFWMGERMEFVRDRTNYLFRIGHNGFLETFVEGGFVGVLLLVNIIISSVLKIQKTLLSNFDYGVLRFCLLFMIVICNLTESSFARPQNFLWFVFLLIAISVSDKEHLRRRVGMNITRA